MLSNLGLASHAKPMLNGALTILYISTRCMSGRDVESLGKLAPH
jgi:hypothetical protein